MSRPKILFEDSSVLVIDKPAGMVVHATEKIEPGTLASWLLEYIPTLSEVGEDPLRPGLVHRLDRDTSGVMIVAKTNEVHAFLKQQFQDRAVTKTYRALVWGMLSEERGVIDRPIGHSSGDARRRSLASGARGALRAATTYWKRLEQFPEAGVSHLELYPKTGRTHQLRIHLESIGRPLVCDTLYGSGRQCPVFGLSRQALHALSLAIEIPEKGLQTFSSELPTDFEKALSELRGREVLFLNEKEPVGA